MAMTMMPRVTWRRRALAVVLAATGVVRVSTQQPTFKAAIELVRLDVTALDKNRHPVEDLTAADFIVTEDGKRQPVA